MSRKQPDLFDFKPTAKILSMPPARFIGKIRIEAEFFNSGEITPDEAQERRERIRGLIVRHLVDKLSQPRAIAVAQADGYITALDAEIVRQRLHGSPATAPKAG